MFFGQNGWCLYWVTLVLVIVAFVFIHEFKVTVQAVIHAFLCSFGPTCVVGQERISCTFRGEAAVPTSEQC